MRTTKLLAVAMVLGCALSIAACGGSGPDTTRAVETTTGTDSIGFQVKNPSDFERPAEFIHVTLSKVPAEWHADQLGNLQIVHANEASSQPLRSSVVDSGTNILPSGEILSLELVFVDDLAPNGTSQYRIQFSQTAQQGSEPFGIERLVDQEMGDKLRIQDGERTFFIGHELEPADKAYNGQLTKDLYVRLEGPGGPSKLMPLTHIYFNIPTYRDQWLIKGACESLFVISPGLPSDVSFEANALTAHVHLVYSGWAQAFCLPPYNAFVNPRPIDFYKATVDLTFYRGQSRVDSHTEIALDKGFYNHNGFALGGVETSNERPRVVFGDSAHTVLQGALWADTDETTDRTEFMQIENNHFFFRRAATRDAGAPFDTLAESDSFKDYYVVEGSDGRGVFAYFPDFRRLAYQALRNEDTQEVPVNMIGAGPSVPLMVANPIIVSQSHLGDIGDVWVPIAPGKYVYDISADLSVAFDPQDAPVYDLMAERLARPVQVSLLPNVEGLKLATPSSTVAAPSTSTPVPSPTVTPTPVIASCDPPERREVAVPMEDGSLLERFDGGQLRNEEGVFVLEGRGEGQMGNEYMEAVRIPGPFTVDLSFDIERPTDVGELGMTGRLAGPGRPSWEGKKSIAFIRNEYGQGFCVRDGQAEDSYHCFPVSNDQDQLTLRVHFLNACGKQFNVLRQDGSLVGFYDMTTLGDQVFENGLFPDGVVHFYAFTAPGTQMRIFDYSVTVP